MLERGRVTRARVFQIIVLICALMGLNACSLPLLLPSAIFPSTYVINRNGNFYVGSRCWSQLTRVAAEYEDQVDGTEDWPSRNKIIWAAEADLPGLTEFLVFKSGQKNARVLVDNSDLDHSRDIRVFMEDHVFGVGHVVVTMDKLMPGKVGAASTMPAAIMTWQQYKNMPEDQFGCEADWQGR